MAGNGVQQPLPATRHPGGIDDGRVSPLRRQERLLDDAVIHSGDAYKSRTHFIDTAVRWNLTEHVCRVFRDAGTAISAQTFLSWA
jgi:hypothetical protein